MHIHTNTAYRRTDRVDKGSEGVAKGGLVKGRGKGGGEGGWQKKGRAKKMV